jgi:hypothetical protein
MLRHLYAAAGERVIFNDDGSTSVLLLEPKPPLCEPATGPDNNAEEGVSQEQLRISRGSPDPARPHA